MLGSLRPLLRPAIERLVGPIARSGVSPDMVSLCAIPAALVSACYLHLGLYQEGFWWGLAAALIDLLDGTVARLQGRSSPFGNYLETMIDRIVEMILVLGLCERWPFAAALALGTSLMVSYAKARVGLVIVTDNHDWPALGERPERLTLFLTACQLEVWYPGAMACGLWLLALMCAWGTWARIRYARHLIEAADADGTLLPYLRHSDRP